MEDQTDQTTQPGTVSLSPTKGLTFSLGSGNFWQTAIVILIGLIVFTLGIKLIAMPDEQTQTLILDAAKAGA